MMRKGIWIYSPGFRRLGKVLADVAELVLQRNKYDLAAAAGGEWQSGNGDSRAVFKLVDIFAAAQLLLKLRA